MSPDEVKKVVLTGFANIVCEPRRNPDGWAFYLGRVDKSRNSTRIARAVRSTPQASTKFKRSVTARLSGTNGEVEVHTADQVRRLFEEELELWQRHFGSAEG